MENNYEENPPKNASYWKRQAKRYQEELLTANTRINELEKEIERYKSVPGLIQIAHMLKKNAELEEACAEHLKSARKNWDAYQMEVTKTEELQARMTGLLNLTDNESSEGTWRVTLDWENSQDTARVLDGDGNVIGECFDIDSEDPNDLFIRAIDIAIKQNEETL